MAIDLVYRQFRLHTGCMGALVALALNQRSVMRDTKVMPMGSDRESLEVDSKSWTGIGFGSTQPTIPSKFNALDHIRSYLMAFIPAIIVLHIIEQVVDGEVSFDALSIFRALTSQLPEALCGIALLLLVIFMQKIRSILKKS
ncbi:MULTISPECIES: hypothetical protein [Rhizobium]|uniref:Uncharacterized protein n=1 Tax=Rhizobium tropici TaxID=398 RepID=A0A6P1C8R7_RHITR|nr:MULTISPECIES: hypothetical protein [Rhizobium]MBB4243246.1 hypothetical protein [Rhizobium tropici]MBB5594889.1 hypothetical protein [Rhizobium tropici]MBB6493572.1 hypothetical protein [Rhizobium tropici]NEV13619.1 hypothetical protein [Rhizobium tropici]TGE95296.1 hypothetical protein C9417_20430 [Rhizobium sp. SEMIA 4088]